MSLWVINNNNYILKRNINNKKTRMNARMYDEYVYTFMHTFVSVCMYANLSMYIYICTYVCVCVYVCICIYAYIHAWKVLIFGPSVWAVPMTKSISFSWLCTNLKIQKGVLIEGTTPQVIGYFKATAIVQISIYNIYIYNIYIIYIYNATPLLQKKQNNKIVYHLDKCTGVCVYKYI